MRVLLVEDELQLAEQLGRALSQAGYAVDHAADGARGEFLGRTEGYDAVILDLGLPKVDGLTVLKQWREAGLAMPVLGFACWPLMRFTGEKAKMGEFVNPWWIKLLGWTSTLLIIGLNVKLLLDIAGVTGGE